MKLKRYLVFGDRPLRELGTIEATSATEACWEWNCSIEATAVHAIVARPVEISRRLRDEDRVS